jgi:hypothetical protein
MGDVTEKFDKRRFISPISRHKPDTEEIRARNRLRRCFIESIGEASELSDGTWDYSDEKLMDFLEARFEPLETVFLAAQKR